MPMTKQEVLADVVNERIRQDSMWGPDSDKNLTTSDWALILEEQLAKLKRERLAEAVVGTPGHQKYFPVGAPSPRERFIKIAAVAVAAVENLY